MPYAYVQTTKHEFITNLLKIYLTFRHRMLRSTDYTADPIIFDVFPPLNTWLIEADSVPVDAVDNEWIDEYTLMLTTDTVSSRPSQVTVEYNGPNENLAYRWGKQIEPFGPLFSYDMNWYLNPSYYDRGDPADADFVKTDLTTDGAWHELDLSGIVPEGAKAVSISLYIVDNLAGQIVRFRRAGNVNIFAITGTATQVAYVPIFTHCICAVDENRKIEYYCSNTSFTGIQITINGWWL
jgi:hypothetical protein